MDFKQRINLFLENPLETAFLAGAGISVPPPSSLPTAIKFMNKLFESSFLDEETNSILNSLLVSENSVRETVGDYLRFESVMEIIHSYLDNDLDILRIFSSCKYPNYYHKFLAKQLEKGAIVLTTNFDNLIEHACLKEKIEFDLIVTGNDFHDFLACPDKYPHPLIKLHGGIDIVRNNDTIEKGNHNIGATLRQVGRHILAPIDNSHIHKTLSYILSQRRLIVIGYSGADDFDILPAINAKPKTVVTYKVDDIDLGFQEEASTIKKGIFWVNHRQENGISEIYSQDSDFSNKKKTKSGILLDPHIRLYQDLSKKVDNSKLLFIEGNTSNILQISSSSESNSSQNYDWLKSFTYWRERYLKNDLEKKVFISICLYHSHRYANKTKQFIKEVLDNKIDLSAETSIRLQSILGDIQVNVGEYADATKLFKNIVSSTFDSPDYKASSYYQLARMYTNTGDFNEALQCLNKAAQILQGTGNWSIIAAVLYEFGRVYVELGMISYAIHNFIESLKRTEPLGLVVESAMTYYELGCAYHKLNQNEDAIKVMNIAIDRLSLTNYPDGLATVYHGLGNIFESDDNLNQAADCYKKAISWGKKGGHRINLAHSLNNLGSIYGVFGDFENAQEVLFDSLKIEQEIGDLKGSAYTYSNLGGVFYRMGRFIDAVNYLEKAIKLFQDINEDDAVAETRRLLNLAKSKLYSA